MKHEENVTIKHTYFTCDICNYKYGEPDTCLACKKHICREHRIFWDYNPFTGDYHGDYPSVVCTNCNEKLDKYRDKLNQILDKHEAEINEISESWIKECKEK